MFHRTFIYFDYNTFLKVILILYTVINVINNVKGDRGSFEGCYSQNLYLKKLVIFSGSSDVCIHACESIYYRYAVLKGNECFCTDIINETEVKTDECDRPCTENVKEFCGGAYTQSYYDTGIKVPGPPQNLEIINRTDSSILIQWSAPEQMKSLTQYIIRANVIKKYGSKLLSPLPQWAVEKTGHTIQYELFNLNPGTTYNFSVTSYSNEGEGGMSWKTGETDINIPDPAPPQPQILNSNGKQMTIEIPPLINNNGPISAIHVVVIFVDSELLQEFDENLLKGYKQASDDGLSYYITAELANERSARKFVIGNGLNYGGYDNVPLPSDRNVHVSLGIVSQLGKTIKKRYSRDATNKNAELIVPINNDNIDDGNNLEMVLLIGCSLLSILLVLSVVGYLYLRLKMTSQMQRLPSDHHELTLQGPIMEVENNDAYQSEGFSQKTFDQKLNEILDQIDLNKNHARNNLALEVNNMIAAGQYGDIISGKLEGKPCHVHVISDDMEPICQTQFLKEFKALAQLDSHKNVVEFYGICQSTNWLYFIFEDTNKSLKKVLIESRTTDPRNFSSLSELFILQTLCELSTAMEFLSQKKFIHGKLNSHSIRMTRDNIPKISCFGPCFDTSGKAIELSRWSAPEMLRFQHFSVQGDVWSFGCVIWECLAIGGTLYPRINANELIYRIKDGARPEPLPYVNNDMHQLLLNCWQDEPSERPSFSEITSMLWQFLSSPQHILLLQRREGYTLPYYLPLLEEQNA